MPKRKARASTMRGPAGHAASVHPRFRWRLAQLGKTRCGACAASAASPGGHSAIRGHLQSKDPIGWCAFVEHLAEHPAYAAARTLRTVQAGRPLLYDLESELAAIEAPGAAAGRRGGRAVPGREPLDEAPHAH